MKGLFLVFSFRMCICLVFFLPVSGCSPEPQKTEVSSPTSSGAVMGGQVQQVENQVVSVTTVLAAIADHEKPTDSDPNSGNRPTFRVQFNERGRGVAYLAEIAGQHRVVHNGKAGRPITGLDRMTISPDGKRIAYSAMVESVWRMVIDDGLGVNSDEVGEPVFSPNGRHIAYEARVGGKSHIIVDNRIMTSAEHASTYGKPVFSSDSTKIAYLENSANESNKRLFVSDISLKRGSVKKSIVSSFIVNGDGTRIAAVKKSGKKQSVIELSFNRPDTVKKGPLYDAVSDIAFGMDEVSLSYVAGRGRKRFLVLNGGEEHLPDGDITGPLVVRPDLKGVGMILTFKGRSFLHQAFYKDGMTKKEYDEASGLAYNRDGSLHAYAARKGKDWFTVVNGKEGPAFDRVVSPVFSPDGRKLVSRVRKDGRRFIVVADTEGKILRQHPAYEQVFQPVFTADGKSVAYGVKDGRKLIWKVEKL